MSWTIEDPVPMKEKKIQNRFFGCLIAVASFIILIIILQSIKVTPLKVFQDPQYHFSLKYPAYWQVVTHPQDEKLILAAFALPFSPETDKFRENISITLVDLSRLPQLMDLNRFTARTIKQAIAAFGEYADVVESRQLRMDGIPAYRFSFVTRAGLADVRSRMKHVYVWFIRGRYGYILAFMGDMDAVNANLKHFNRMVRTFKFEK